jgi:hypothetical protein
LLIFLPKEEIYLFSLGFFLQVIESAKITIFIAMTTNWEALALKMGILNADGSESYLGQNEYTALELILGDEWIRHAVDTFIEGKPGNELAIKTIRHLYSKKAAEYAYQVFLRNKEQDFQRANLAIFAMCDILHPLCMTYLPEFLKDEKYTGTGLWLMRQLLFASTVHYQSDQLLDIMKGAKYGDNETIDAIRVYIRDEM